MVDALDAAQLDRYSRQLMVESIGEADQRQLLSSRVLVVGAGGLGSAIVQYLTAAGVGTLGIVDDGAVKQSNLGRQTIHGIDDVGDPKVDSAARFVEALNPDVEVERHPVRVGPDVVESLVDGYDVIVDGLDNFPARFLLNDVARLEGVPFVHGAVYELEGQTSVFRPGGSCYRCLLPEMPDSDVAPSGEPMGIFPTVPATIGCFQATETLKLLLELGDVLDEHLLRYDAMDTSFTRTPLDQRPDCPCCGGDEIDSFADIEYDARWRIVR